jgi:hypothetical protein
VVGELPTWRMWKRLSLAGGTPGRYTPMRQKQYMKNVQYSSAPISACSRFNEPARSRQEPCKVSVLMQRQEQVTGSPASQVAEGARQHGTCKDAECLVEWSYDQKCGQ